MVGEVRFSSFVYGRLLGTFSQKKTSHALAFCCFFGKGQVRDFTRGGIWGLGAWVSGFQALFSPSVRRRRRAYLLVRYASSGGGMERVTMVHRFFFTQDSDFFGYLVASVPHMCLYECACVNGISVLVL